MLKLTGLWVNVDRNGHKFFSGTVSPGIKLLIYRNDHKEEGSNQPDYVAFLADARPQMGDETGHDGEPF